MPPRDFERLEPRENSEVAIDDLFGDYVVWCRWRQDEPYAKGVFAQQLRNLAEEVGIPTRGAGDQLVCLDVGLVGR